MELIFNELSLKPPIDSEHAANLAVEKLIATYSKAKPQGFQKIRFHQTFETIALAEGYTFLDWLNGTTNRTLKNLLLAAKVYPFIDEEDEQAEEEYVRHRYFFENDFIEKTEPQGLAAALIYQTLAISLDTDAYWQTSRELPVLIEYEAQRGLSIINHVSHICTADSLEDTHIQDFIGRITVPVLITCDVPADQKAIHLRDDHGKDTLDRFAKRLIKSEYVISVINSLPFNPKATQLIHKTHPDGKVELVLHWEDKGYGLVLKTTGRNIHETKAIAKILEQKYDE